jgi:hypothetical protein
MDDLTREQKLANVLSFHESQLPDQLDSILHRRNKVRLGTLFQSVARLSEARGVAAFFLHGDVLQLKQNFHVASILKAASVGQDGGEEFGTHRAFLYGMLSDNPEVIDWLASVETPRLIGERDDPGLPRFHLHLVQLALKDRHDELEARIAQVAKKAPKPLRGDFASGQDFYSLFLKRDKAALEQLLTRHAKKQTGDPLVEDFLAEGSTYRAKLCWIKGMEVQVDSPLVPMELMPVQPLARYDNEYEFLKPGWTPPQGFFGRVTRWLGARS